MNLLGLMGGALAISVAIAGAEGWIIVRQHDALLLERRATAAARSRIDEVQRVRGLEHRQAVDAYRTLQVVCREEAERAASAGRAIERVINAPVAADGRRRIGAGDLRIIAGEAHAGADVPARPDGRSTAEPIRR